MVVILSLLDFILKAAYKLKQVNWNNKTETALGMAAKHRIYGP